MGQQQIRCWTDENYTHENTLLEPGSANTIKINEFQLCKKNQIQDQKIEIEMIIQTHIQDYDVLDDLDTLYFSVEIGESYERDKFKWTERKDFDDIKKKKLEFGFKMNHIKQIIKVEVSGSYVNKNNQNEVNQKTLFIGYFNFARCIRKSGNLIQPQQIGLRLSEDIDVKVGLKEKYKFGGYRCITLKVFDTKGGDFVENQDLSILVVESQRNNVVTEIPKDLPLIQGPDGFYKRIEIGVNNYSPSIFMTQHFKVFFVKDSKDYSQFRNYESSVGLFEPINEMKSEQDILQERLENDLIAFGEFSAIDLMQNSVCPDDFINLENLVEKQKNRSQSNLSMLDQQDQDDEISEYKLSLFSKAKNQQIGLITLRNIQCKQRTSFLDLIANQMLEIVPIIAIDFSLSNLTFDERKCIHTVNEDNPNEYRDLLVAISKAFRQISPTSLFYGFGANSVAKKTEVSDLFVGTGDLLNPIVMTDHLEQAYYSCLKRVELNLPVHISGVLSKSIEFANQSQTHFLVEEKNKNEYKHALTYYVVYILSTGLIDDIPQSIEQFAQVMNLPLSVYIINLQNKNLRKDDLDATMLEDKCKFLFERGNRKFLKVMEYGDLGFQTLGLNEVINKLTEKIPFEIEQYFDSIASQGKKIHIEQNQVRKGLDLVREVMRQKEQFLDTVECHKDLTREQVNKLIEEFKLYEYSIDSAEILSGLKVRVDKS